MNRARTWDKLIASVGGLGYIPWAPGTWGALGGMVVLVPLTSIGFLNFQVILACAIVAGSILGTIVANRLESHWGKDPSRFVWDELIGVWISLLFHQKDFFVWTAAFILFRLFDIFKPLGIRKMESLKAGTGVMADDILAGIYANISLHLLIYIKGSWF